MKWRFSEIMAPWDEMMKGCTNAVRSTCLCSLLTEIRECVLCHQAVSPSTISFPTLGNYMLRAFPSYNKSCVCVSCSEFHIRRSIRLEKGRLSAALQDLHDLFMLSAFPSLLRCWTETCHVNPDNKKEKVKTVDVQLGFFPIELSISASKRTRLWRQE